MPTFSAHYLRDPRLRGAVADYLAAERRAVAREIAALGEMTPFRKGRDRKYDPLSEESEAGHAEIALGIAVAAAGDRGRGAPAGGPRRRIFAARDLFDLEAAADPEISPDGRWIAYTRRSGDIMTDRFRPAIWLIDTRSGRQMPLAAGASQPRWSPDGSRLAYIAAGEGGRAQLFVRWMAERPGGAVTGLPDSPSSVAWSPDGRQIAYAMFVPDEGARLGRRRPGPRARHGPTPAGHHRGHLPVRRPGLFARRLRPIVPGLLGGRGAAAALYGPYNNGGPLSWTPDGRSSCSAATARENWEREAVNTEIYALDIASNQIPALTSREGPDNEPAVSPDGRLVAFTGFDDQQRSDRRLPHFNRADAIVADAEAVRRVHRRRRCVDVTRAELRRLRHPDLPLHRRRVVSVNASSPASAESDGDHARSTNTRSPPRSRRTPTTSGAGRRTARSSAGSWPT